MGKAKETNGEIIMQNTSRCREKVEGWRGRRRTYKCMECQTKLHVDTLNPLPKDNRLCDYCQRHTFLYTFVNKKTGKERQVRASSVELATLRAWDINSNLTIKMSEGVTK